MIDVTLKIDNAYEDGDVIETTVRTEVPEPPTEANFEGDSLDEAYQDWAYDNIFCHTGTGRTEGDSAYFVKCIESSDPTMVGAEWEWGT